MFKLGVRLHDINGKNFQEKVSNARKLGFCCAQVSLEKLFPTGEILTQSKLKELKLNLYEEGIEPVILGCYKNLANPNYKAYVKIADEYRQAVDVAALLGATVVGTETGAPNTSYIYEPSCRSKESLDILIDRIFPIVEYAKQAGINLAIEPVALHIAHNAARVRTVLDAIPMDNLKVILDPVNLLDVTNIEDRDEIIQNAYRLLGKDIIAVHLKDCTKNGLLDEVPLGKGLIDFTSSMNFLLNNPSIPAIFEGTRPDNIEESIEFLRTFHAE
jgi:sugar phosphate isomerase/epimerase